MRRNRRPTGPRAVVVAAVESALVAAAAVGVADVGVMIIRGTHASRVNRAGSFLVSWKQPDAEAGGPAPLAKKLGRNCECHEDDPLLINARKSRRGNKNSARKPSAGYSVNRTSRKALWSTRCRKCASTPRHRRRCSALDPKTNPVRGKR